MAAAALIFREALEVWLGVTIVLSIAGGTAREYTRPLLLAIGAAFLLGGAIGAGAGVFGAGLGVKAKAIFQASLMGLGALLMVRAVLTDPPYVRLERRLAELPAGSRVSVVRVVLSMLVSITVLTSVLLYDCIAGAWGAADLLGGVLGTAMGVFVGLLGAVAMLLVERLEPRAWRALVGVMAFVFLGYLVAFDLDAFPKAGLIPSPHVGPDRGVSAIATVLGISSVVLLARFALRRGQIRPGPFLALINPLFIGFAAYFAMNALQQLALWRVITFPEEGSWGVLVVATVLLGVAFLRGHAHLPPLETAYPLATGMEKLTRLQRVRLRWAVVRERRHASLPGEERAGG